MEYLALEVFWVQLLMTLAIDLSRWQVLLLGDFQGVPDP